MSGQKAQFVLVSFTNCDNGAYTPSDVRIYILLSDSGLTRYSSRCLHRDYGIVLKSGWKSKHIIARYSTLISVDMSTGDTPTRSHAAASISTHYCGNR